MAEAPANETARESFLTTAEFAGMVRISEATARAWRNAGYGPASFKVGRRVLYVEDECRAWLESQRAAAGAP